MRARLLVGGLAGLALVLPSAAVADDVDTAPTRSFVAATDTLYAVAQQPGTGRLWTVENNSGTKILSFYEAGATGFPTRGAFIDLTGCGATFPAFNPAGTQLAVPCAGGSVLRFSVNAAADVAPLASLSGAGTAYGVAVAADGDVLVPDQAGDMVRIYEPASSLTTPARIVFGSSIDAPTDVAIGPDGNIYVLNDGASPTVTVYPADANGPMVPLRTITIPGGIFELYSLAVDDGGNVYVGGFGGGLMVFAPGVGGGSTPIKYLFGPKSNLTGVISVIVDGSRRVIVGEKGTRVATFPALVPYRVPGAVRSLTVAGKKTDKKRLVTWQAPTASDKPVTAYLVTVTKGKRTVLIKTVAKPKLTLKRKKLPTGKLKVSVVARSSVGPGPVATATFKVKQPKKKK